MLSLRRELPVYSPVRFRSLLAGAAGALGAGHPRERLLELLAGEFGTENVLLTDSGTSALRLALSAAARFADGASRASSARGTVLLPAYCCYDVATAAVGASVRVRLYDLDPDTLGPDWSSLEAALDEGASAVVAVHLYGLPVDIERCARLAEQADALLIEDAAQGFGGRLRGRRLGSLGALGVLSFGRGKGVTGGGGGALLANDESGRRALDLVRDIPAPGLRGAGPLVRLAAQWALGRPSIYGLPAALPWLGLGETHYRSPRPPRGIGRGPAAAVVANWEASCAEALTRRERAGRLADLGLPGVVAALKAGGCPLRLPLRLAGADRATGREGAVGAERERHLEVREGVVAGYPQPLYELAAAAEWELPAGRCPGAARLARELSSAPVHSRSEPERIRRAVQSSNVT